MSAGPAVGVGAGVGPTAVSDVIDTKELGERVPPALLPSLVAIYRDESARRLKEIAGAIGRRDARELAFHAHALKGSTSTFAATFAGPTSLELEMAGRANNFSLATRLVERLTAEIGELIERLSQMTETHTR
jgi:HPt (histidine-containing phosphotransfer) domain-containing protein